jgi:PPOX class probable F420-dependent enzyme
MQLDDDVRAMLDDPKVFGILGTVGADGTAQVNPMWVSRDDGAVTFNSAFGRAKVRQIERDPRVTLTLIPRDDPYTYVQLRGRVVRTVTGDAAVEHIHALSHKYEGKPFDLPAGQERVAYYMDVERVSRH